MVVQGENAVRLTGPMTLELLDGTFVQIRPGPYKKGLAVVPIDTDTESEARGRGRKPRPGTVKLRQKLARDARAGRLDEPTEYFRWLVKEDETISRAVARQVVYRELRRVQA